MKTKTFSLLLLKAPIVANFKLRRLQSINSMVSSASCNQKPISYLVTSLSRVHAGTSKSMEKPAWKVTEQLSFRKPRSLQLTKTSKSNCKKQRTHNDTVRGSETKVSSQTLHNAKQLQKQGWSSKHRSLILRQANLPARIRIRTDWVPMLLWWTMHKCLMIHN